MYCVYGNSGRYIHGGPLFGGGPLLGGSVIGGSTVIMEQPPNGRPTRVSDVLSATMKYRMRL